MTVVDTDPTQHAVSPPTRWCRWRDRLIAPNSKPWRIEWAGLIVLCTIIVIFHAIAFDRSGALWRDEVSAVNRATLPTWGEIYRLLKFDSVPMGYFFILRQWIHAFGSSDMSLRVFGMLGGLALMVSALGTARWMRVRLPFVILILCALQPVTIYWGDSVRGYSYGTAMLLPVFAAMWHFMRDTTRRNFAIAVIAALLAVHFLYQNAQFVGGICLAGVTVACVRKQWKKIIPILAVGGIAALSMLPYIPIINGYNENVMQISRLSVTMGTMFEWLGNAMKAQAAWTPWVWGSLIAIMIVVAGVQQYFDRHHVRLHYGKRVAMKPPNAGAADRALFAASAMLIGSAMYMVFLLHMAMIPKTAYYIPMMAIMALAVDVVLDPFIRMPLVRGIRLAGAALFVALVLVPTWVQMRVRHTTMDEVCAILNHSVKPGDLVIVQPWHMPVSFGRYYKGAAPWTAIPPVADTVSLHYDDMRMHMQEEDPLQPVRVKIDSTLSHGGTVWVVGSLTFLPPNTYPPTLHPAPDPKYGWNHAVYSQEYMLQIAYYVQTHGKTAEVVPIQSEVPVDGFEAVPLMRITGYVPPAGALDLSPH